MRSERSVSLACSAVSSRRGSGRCRAAAWSGQSGRCDAAMAAAEPPRSPSPWSAEGLLTPLNSFCSKLRQVCRRADAVNFAFSAGQWGQAGDDAYVRCGFGRSSRSAECSCTAMSAPILASAKPSTFSQIVRHVPWKWLLLLVSRSSFCEVTGWEDRTG